MISEFILWQGHFPSLYENEIEGWTREVLESESLNEDEVTRIDLSQFDDCNNPTIQTLFDGDSVLFEPRKIIHLDNIDSWDAARINVLMKGLGATDVELFIAGIQRSGAVLKSVKEALTDDPRVRRIPDSVDDMAHWLMDWLEERQILIEEDAAYNLVEHSGEESEILVSTMMSLATIPDKDTMLGWDEVRKYAGDIGAVAIYKITGYIVDGDSDNALRTLARIANSVHPLQLLKLLSNRYRQYLLLIGGPSLSNEEIVELTGGNPKALFFTRKEASKLGLVRAIQGLGFINDSYHDVKGVGQMGQDDSMRVLVTRLAHGFRMASSRR